MTRKLRLLFVNEYFPPAILGGAEVSTLEQARAMAAEGHEVTVLTPHYDGPKGENVDGVRVERFAFPPRLTRDRSPNPHWFQNPLFYGYLGFHTWRRARTADVVHAQNSFSLVGAYLGARLAGARFVVTIRDYMHLCSGGAICLHDRDLPPHRCSLRQYRECFHLFRAEYEPGAGRWRRFKASLRHALETLDVKVRQVALARADSVVTVSDAVGVIYRAAGLLDREPVTVYNVPPRSTPAPAGGRDLWKIPVRAPLVLYVGKQSFGKGTDVLLASAKRIHQRNPSVHFLLVGRKNPLIELPEDSRFVATGALPHDEVMALYAEADVVVLPAVWKEPFPRSLLEAMAAGKPVVAARSGGIVELVRHEETGILVPPKDEQALAEALLRVLDDASLATRMGQKGRERVQTEFDRDGSLSSLRTAYGEERD